jgi:hypothetical protein
MSIDLKSETAAAKNSEKTPAQNVVTDLVDISQKKKGKDRVMILDPLL